MFDFISNPDAWNNIGVVGIVVVMAGLVITDKLVWHTRLKDAEKRAQRWEDIAFDALSTSSQASLRAAEVTADVVSAIPTPAQPSQRTDAVADRITRGLNP